MMQSALSGEDDDDQLQDEELDDGAGASTENVGKATHENSDVATDSLVVDDSPFTADAAATTTSAAAETAESPAATTMSTATDSAASINEQPPSHTLTDDLEMIRQAEEFVADERYLQAADRLKRVHDETLLRARHRRIISTAAEVENIMNDLNSNHPVEQGGWRKQGEVHGNRDTLIFYRIDDDSAAADKNETNTSTTAANANANAASKGSNVITVRIETAIEESLLQPIIAVLAESELYHTWVPSWKRPIRLGMESSKKLAERGRGVDQVLSVLFNMPFPMYNRECVQRAIGVDCIDDHQAIVVSVRSLDPDAVVYNDNDEVNVTVSKPEGRTVRVDFNAGILIRSCPADHPALSNSSKNYPPGERLVLLAIKMKMNAHIAGVPQRVINFFTRTVIGRMWGAFLSVAGDIRDGKRPEHAAAMESKRELYEWIEGRVKVMFDLFDQQVEAELAARREEEEKRLAEEEIRLKEEAERLKAEALEQLAREAEEEELAKRNKAETEGKSDDPAPPTGNADKDDNDKNNDNA